jgi:hypothetical protein
MPATVPADMKSQRLSGSRIRDPANSPHQIPLNSNRDPQDKHPSSGTGSPSLADLAVRPYSNHSYPKPSEALYEDPRILGATGRAHRQI